MHESLAGLEMDRGLVERVAASTPAWHEMTPSLPPALRLGFGRTAALFATSAWVVNLPRLYGAGETATQIGLGAIMLGAAIGATAIAIAILQETGARAIGTVRTMLAGVAGNALVATVAAAALMGTAWFLLGKFPNEYMASGLRAARSTAAVTVVVLLAAAAAQIYILTHGAERKPALRLVEAAGLAVAAVACAANYVIFIA